MTPWTFIGMQDYIMQQVLVLTNEIILLNEANNRKEHFQQMILVLAESSHRCHGRCKHGSLEIVIDMTQEMWNRAIFPGKLFAKITIYSLKLDISKGLEEEPLCQ